MRQHNIVIVGAGIVGLSTAFALLSQGEKNVTILEQEAVDHRRSTSHGFSRLLRHEYGTDLLYAQMVSMSLSRWKRLERISRRTLYTQTGVLVLGNEQDNFTYPSYLAMRELGLPVQRLTEQQCQAYYPQFSTTSFDIFTHNMQAGILYASNCLRTLKSLILDMGGTICESCRVVRIEHEVSYQPIHMHCSSGDEITADRVVLATGPWVHRLLPDLHLPIRITRQHLLYFSGLPLSSFGIQAFPAFMTNDLYGFPIHSNHHGPNWLKAACHTFGTPIDPDQIIQPDEYIVHAVAKKLYAVIPALQQATLAHVDTCMYDVSPDEDFILDRLPYDPRIVFATGLTGHGFKFGPLLGEIMSSLLRDTPSPVPTERFRLARFARRHQHQTEHISVA